MSAAEGYLCASGGPNGVRWQVRRAADLSAAERAALGELSLAVYPPGSDVDWPGRAVEWAACPWCVIGSAATGEALGYVGIVLRNCLWNGRAVKAGGIGGVKTHPAARRRGLATAAIALALDFFTAQGDIDFALLVCEPALVPFYERLGWRRFPGELFVTQGAARTPFTFNSPMTIPIRMRESLAGSIDLLGPPW